MRHGTKLLGMAALAAAALLPAPAQAGTFAYADFSDTTGLQINGSAAATNIAGRDVMRLTPPQGNSGGSVFNTQAIALTNDYGFSTRFTFNIGSNGDTPYGPIGADGIAFVIQTVSNNVGGTGGGMGYAGISPSVAVEFDTYSNGFDPDFNGNLTANNHIAIMQNGDSTNHLAYANVASTLNLSGGSDITAFVDYNGATNLMEVRWSTDGLRPGSAGLSYTIDLGSLFGTNPVFVGFTGGTGANWSEQDIVNWTFNDNYDPVTAGPTETVPAGSTLPGAVPEPASWALMIGGFGVAGAALRRRSAAMRFAIA
ncbi:MAG TPA: PEPxxWA-CTERM sorting domain-containing protein [Sphingobium sp.]